MIDDLENFKSRVVKGAEVDAGDGECDCIGGNAAREERVFRGICRVSMRQASETIMKSIAAQGRAQVENQAVASFQSDRRASESAENAANRDQRLVPFAREFQTFFPNTRIDI